MMMMNYAVLFAPEFRLQATLRHAPEPAQQPAALVDLIGTRPCVVERNDEARALSVEPGMTPTQALARCPDLRLVTPNAGHERSAQGTLLQTAETLSPFLESTAPGVVTIDLPPERLFQESELIRCVIEPLRSLRLAVRIGVAGTPDLALLAARHASPARIIFDPRSFLTPLPLASLEMGDELAAVLESWGIRTIGQFLALPAAQAWERLGPEAVALAQRVTGRNPRPLALVRPPDSFSEAADLEHPVEMLEPLLFLLRRFLEQISMRLAHAYLVAGKLQLVLRFERDEPYRRVFTIPQPTREVDLLFRMLHTHLENFTSPSAIVALELAAAPTRPRTQQIGLLDRGLRDPHQFAETLARLQALLGPGEVGTPEITSSHHPDAFTMRPYDPEATPGPGNSSEILIGAPWLRFRPPLPARVILNKAGPAFLHSSPSTGPIREACGPWRLAGNWWEVERSWSREEWDIATSDGCYRLVLTGARWFLDGIYA
jgi:protein ImuB